jgi:XTP/dITP diphosphohydrolase
LKLVLATRNADKIREIREILGDLAVELIPVSQFDGVPEVEESGETLAENARRKALAVARATGHAALADDTGLEVEAIGGAPGVFSARYAGPDASYADNVRKLLDVLAAAGTANRRALFRTIVALATPDGEVWTVEGACDGSIARRPRGAGGFGYDPVFVPDGQSRTFAEMPPESKHAVSHRGRAFRAAREMIARWREVRACRDSNAGPAA